MKVIPNRTDGKDDYFGSFHSCSAVQSCSKNLNAQNDTDNHDMNPYLFYLTIAKIIRIILTLSNNNNNPSWWLVASSTIPYPRSPHTTQVLRDTRPNFPAHPLLHNYFKYNLSYK